MTQTLNNRHHNEHLLLGLTVYFFNWNNKKIIELKIYNNWTTVQYSCLYHTFTAMSKKFPINWYDNSQSILTKNLKLYSAQNWIIGWPRTALLGTVWWSKKVVLELAIVIILYIVFNILKRIFSTTYIVAQVDSLEKVICILIVFPVTKCSSKVTKYLFWQ